MILYIFLYDGETQNYTQKAFKWNNIFTKSDYKRMGHVICSVNIKDFLLHQILNAKISHLFRPGQPKNTKQRKPKWQKTGKINEIRATCKAGMIFYFLKKCVKIEKQNGICAFSVLVTAPSSLLLCKLSWECFSIIWKSCE